MTTEIKYGLGCEPFVEDNRDYKFNDLYPCASGTYPIEYLPSIPDIRLNQGMTSMCVAFALSLSRYMHELEQSNNKKLLSPGYIYGNRASLDWKGEGMYVRQALNTLKKYGVCYSSSLNITGTYQECKAAYDSNKNELDTEAYPYRISSYWRLYNDNAIKQSIMTIGYAVVSYNVYDNWYNVGKDGRIGLNSGTNHGAHAVLLTGWTKNGEWRFNNSWGSNWGDNGIGYVPMTVTMNEAWSLMDNIQENFFTSLKDVKNHWAKASIDKAVQYGILKGYEDGTFKPDEPITRAEACAIVAKLTNYTNENYNNSPFSDVTKDDWYFNYVVHCQIHNKVNGYEDGTFRPNNRLTRAEATKLLTLISKIYINSTIKDSAFTDVSKSHWAIKFINALTDRGVINGYEDGTFRPDSNITRAEFITIVDRLNLIK